MSAEFLNSLKLWSPDVCSKWEHLFPRQVWYHGILGFDISLIKMPFTILRHSNAVYKTPSIGNSSDSLNDAINFA